MADEKRIVVPVTGKATSTGLESLADQELALKEGKFRLPGMPMQDLVGIKPGDLEEARHRWEQAKAQLLIDLRSRWQCTQCKRTWRGRDVRVRKPREDMEEAVYVCPRAGCEGPVIRVVER